MLSILKNVVKTLMLRQCEREREFRPTTNFFCDIILFSTVSKSHELLENGVGTSLARFGFLGIFVNCSFHQHVNHSNLKYRLRVDQKVMSPECSVDSDPRDRSVL